MAGVLAGLVTESNIVGGVSTVLETVPPVVRFRLGYEQGVEFIAAVEGKEVETLGVYIDDFFAPDRGASAARANDW